MMTCRQGKNKTDVKQLHGDPGFGNMLLSPRPNCAISYGAPKRSRNLALVPVKAKPGETQR